jgi:hypothetical protein
VDGAVWVSLKLEAVIRTPNSCSVGDVGRVCGGLIAELGRNQNFIV